MIQGKEMSWKVFVTRKIPQPGIDLLINNGFNIKIFEDDQPITRKKLLEKIKNVDALLPLLTDTISSEIIRAGKQLKIIANYAAGYNNIDLQ